jgi:hypothetical protein
MTELHPAFVINDADRMADLAQAFHRNAIPIEALDQNYLTRRERQWLAEHLEKLRQRRAI